MFGMTKASRRYVRTPAAVSAILIEPLDAAPVENDSPAADATYGPRPLSAPGPLRSCSCRVSSSASEKRFIIAW
jgi:hypothetical protein